MQHHIAIRVSAQRRTPRKGEPAKKQFAARPDRVRVITPADPERAEGWDGTERIGNRSERTESPRSVREKECFDQRNVTRLGQLAEPCVAVYKMNSDAELLQVADLIGWCGRIRGTTSERVNHGGEVHAREGLWRLRCGKHLAAHDTSGNARRAVTRHLRDAVAQRHHWSRGVVAAGGEESINHVGGEAGSRRVVNADHVGNSARRRRNCGESCGDRSGARRTTWNDLRHLRWHPVERTVRRHALRRGDEHDATNRRMRFERFK